MGCKLFVAGSLGEHLYDGMNNCYLFYFIEAPDANLTQ
jgi:hypothetical protein